MLYEIISTAILCSRMRFMVFAFIIERFRSEWLLLNFSQISTGHPNVTSLAKEIATSRVFPFSAGNNGNCRIQYKLYVFQKELWKAFVTLSVFSTINAVVTLTNHSYLLKPHLPLPVKFCNLHKHLFPCQGSLLKTWGLGYSDYNSSTFLLKGQYKHTKEHFVFLSKLNPVVLLNNPSLACWEWSNWFL